MQVSLDSLIKEIEARKNLHGVVSIKHQNEVVYSSPIGYSNIKLKQKADTSTLFAIGSITKTYIATIILQLVEEKSIKLTDKLVKFQPDIPFASDITINDLLKHQSGISDNNYFKWKYGGKRFKRVDKPTYSNVNYGLLGLIIEQLENKTLDQVLQERIVDPLGLHHTYYLTQGQDSLIAKSYSFQNKKWTEQSFGNLENAGGAGGMISSAEDVNRFFSALFQAKLISQESLDIMRSMDAHYAMALFPGNFFAHQGYCNSGQYGHYHSTVVYFPKSELSITILSNGTNTSLNLVLRQVLDILDAEGSLI